MKLLQLAVSTQMVSALPPHPSLSPRQNEVLALLSVGARPREIALTLAITKRTVETYIGRIADKLDVEAETGRSVTVLIVRKATEDLLLAA